jgi:hypothetical protein
VTVQLVEEWRANYKIEGSRTVVIWQQEEIIIARITDSFKMKMQHLLQIVGGALSNAN